MTPATALASPTILVIEDHSDAREVLTIILRQKGYNVIEAENGLRGLLQARGNYPDLIIMDLALPEMDGVETARRIRETPELSHIPIFAVSGFLTRDVEADVRAAGCVQMFKKPFDFESLLESISLVLAKRVGFHN
jgi:two-component system, cell cycle response regulator DivK